MAVWHRTASDTAVKTRVRDTLRRVLQLPATVPIEYKAHSDCLRASTAHALAATHNHNHASTSHDDSSANSSRADDERS